MAYQLTIRFTNGTSEVEYYHSEENAEQSAREWDENFEQGGDYLELAGRSRCDYHVKSTSIKEISDSKVDDYQYYD